MNDEKTGKTGQGKKTSGIGESFIEVIFCSGCVEGLDQVSHVPADVLDEVVQSVFKGELGIMNRKSKKVQEMVRKCVRIVAESAKGQWSDRLNLSLDKVSSGANFDETKVSVDAIRGRFQKKDEGK